MGAVESIGEAAGESDVLVELADGQQAGAAGQPARRRLPDERSAKK